MLGYLIVVITVSSLGVFGNVLVLATLVIDRKLHVLNNLFIGNLAVADLFIAGIIHPFTAVGIIGGHEYLFYQDNGEITYLCEFLASFCIISCSASVLSIGAVAVNRYVYICHNRIYNKIYTPRTIPFIVAGIWIIGALIDMPTYLGFGDHVFHERIYSCFFDPLHPEYKLFFVIVGILSPVALTVYCYARIVALVYKSSRRLKQQTGKYSTKKNHDSRNSNIRSADVRLLKTVAAMAVLAVIIYTPFAITLLVDRGQVSSTVWMFSNGIMHSFSCMDWLIYAVTNTRIRDGFTFVLGKFLICRRCVKEPDQTINDSMTRDKLSGTVVGTVSELCLDACKSPEMQDTPPNVTSSNFDMKPPEANEVSEPSMDTFSKAEDTTEENKGRAGIKPNVALGTTDILLTTGPKAETEIDPVSGIYIPGFSAMETAAT